MEDAASDLMPSYYENYLSRKHSITNDEIKRRLHRFPYRYRLAKAFTGINAVGLGKSKAGYEAGMKVFLAYTAYEEIHDAALLMKARSAQAKGNTIRSNNVLAAKLRKNERLKKLLLAHADDEKLRSNLNNFYNGITNDMMVLACAIRNIYAHGEFTAGGAGLVVAADCKDMRSIADEVLDYCDELFRDCTNKL